MWSSDGMPCYHIYPELSLASGTAKMEGISSKRPIRNFPPNVWMSSWQSHVRKFYCQVFWRTLSATNTRSIGVWDGCPTFLETLRFNSTKSQRIFSSESHKALGTTRKLTQWMCPNHRTKNEGGDNQSPNDLQTSHFQDDKPSTETIDSTFQRKRNNEQWR
jgi:hypothetical protein